MIAIPSLIEHKFSQTCDSLAVLPSLCSKERERERERTSDNYFQRRARRSQRAATRTNLIGSFTFSRDISIRICIPRGKSVGFSLSPFRREAWEMCRFFSVAPAHPLTHPLSFVPSFSLVHPPFRTRPLSFFLKINSKPRFRLRATNTRRYIYFFYCLAPEFPIVSRNLSLHGKFGHAEAGAFILRRG